MSFFQANLKRQFSISDISYACHAPMHGSFTVSISVLERASWDPRVMSRLDFAPRLDLPCQRCDKTCDTTGFPGNPVIIPSPLGDG